MLILILSLALLLLGGVLGALMMLVIGIHTTERHASLHAAAPGLHSRTEIASRRVLSVYVRDHTAAR